jgi:hypothetical protein
VLLFEEKTKNNSMLFIIKKIRTNPFESAQIRVQFVFIAFPVYLG